MPSRRLRRDSLRRVDKSQGDVKTYATPNARYRPAYLSGAGGKYSSDTRPKTPAAGRFGGTAAALFGLTALPPKAGFSTGHSSAAGG